MFPTNIYVHYKIGASTVDAMLVKEVVCSISKTFLAANCLFRYIGRNITCVPQKIRHLGYHINKF